MAGSSAYRPPTDAKTDVQIDLEQWGLESRPLGGLVDFIKNTTNPMHHVTEGCQLEPINVENSNNGNATRTEKRLGWSTEEDLRLEANSLYASGECNVDLMAKAQKIYENDFKDGPFLLTQCWNELKTQPKWHAYLDQLDKLTSLVGFRVC
uniref:No apical meristem-associated C-terminal domain-containing protein n=1 Tax=Oryza glaberrima TaxID=4538 RepID=I1NN93_ORYGL